LNEFDLSKDDIEKKIIKNKKRIIRETERKIISNFKKFLEKNIEQSSKKLVQKFIDQTEEDSMTKDEIDNLVRNAKDDIYGNIREKKIKMLIKKYSKKNKIIIGEIKDASELSDNILKTEYKKFKKWLKTNDVIIDKKPIEIDENEFWDIYMETLN
jgi:hypothetical protein